MSKVVFYPEDAFRKRRRAISARPKLTPAIPLTGALSVLLEMTVMGLSVECEFV